MEYINRILNINEKLKHKSVLLLGPRQTGKTSYINNELKENIKAKWDLLNIRIRMPLQKDPEILHDQINSLNINPEKDILVIDEIQRVPELLDVVHEVIEERKIKFLLTGSSARKIRKEGVNLLGGRVSKVVMLPFTFNELSSVRKVSLEEIFLRGMLPPSWETEEPNSFLVDYIETYLREEIAAEGVTRNLPMFSNFLQLAAIQSGEQLNYSNISNDVGLSRQSVSNWYQVLEDTLLGFQLPTWKKSKIRKSVSISKFYLFDVGLVRKLCGINVPLDVQTQYGWLFENFISMELNAWLNYNKRDDSFCYWRTESGAEVDFIIGDYLAIEVKATQNVTHKHLAGLRKIGEENVFKHRVLVCREVMSKKTEDGILILNWADFIKQLWNNEFL